MAENDYTMAAMILAIIAGIFILLGAIAIMWIAATFNAVTSAAYTYGRTYGAVASGTVGAVGAIFWVSAIMGLVSGVIVMVGGILVRNPQKRVMASVLVLVFSIVSILGGGGFFIGMILGIIAGILGLVSHPGATTPAKG